MKWKVQDHVRMRPLPDEQAPRSVAKTRSSAKKLKRPEVRAKASLEQTAARDAKQSDSRPAGWAAAKHAARLSSITVHETESEYVALEKELSTPQSGEHALTPQRKKRTMSGRVKNLLDKLPSPRRLSRASLSRYLSSSSAST